MCVERGIRENSPNVVSRPTGVLYEFSLFLLLPLLSIMLLQKTPVIIILHFQFSTLPQRVAIGNLILFAPIVVFLSIAFAARQIVIYLAFIVGFGTGITCVYVCVFFSKSRLNGDCCLRIIGSACYCALIQ